MFKKKVTRKNIGVFKFPYLGLQVSPKFHHSIWHIPQQDQEKSLYEQIDQLYSKQSDEESKALVK